MSVRHKCNTTHKRDFFYSYLRYKTKKEESKDTCTLWIRGSRTPYCTSARFDARSRDRSSIIFRSVAPNCTFGARSRRFACSGVDSRLSSRERQSWTPTRLCTGRKWSRRPRSSARARFSASTRYSRTSITRVARYCASLSYIHFCTSMLVHCT